MESTIILGILLLFVIPIGLGYITLPFGRGLLSSQKNDYLEWWGLGLILELLISCVIIILVIIFSLLSLLIHLL